MCLILGCTIHENATHFILCLLYALNRADLLQIKFITTTFICITVIIIFIFIVKIIIHIFAAIAITINTWIWVWPNVFYKWMFGKTHVVSKLVSTFITKSAEWFKQVKRTHTAVLCHNISQSKHTKIWFHKHIIGSITKLLIHHFNVQNYLFFIMYPHWYAACGWNTASGKKRNFYPINNKIVDTWF